MLFCCLDLIRWWVKRESLWPSTLIAIKQKVVEEEVMLGFDDTDRIRKNMSDDEMLVAARDRVNTDELRLQRLAEANSRAATRKFRTVPPY